ncbi:hypothetical protein AXG93_2117s1000 [Marchantia polymorpha subsp. ruderalis]|uniref:t-SNARE coiled-coil homology domain-containing protein n=1 Tax=Marchantia polymorpha subsp. ruderalis TaxID=1480154 RepID=A0A176VPD5_MARPO|nr:hypothetical protein AXG93_2117s1000 [Marchantia polymorpha subsp. ruderalis]
MGERQLTRPANRGGRGFRPAIVFYLRYRWSPSLAGCQQEGRKEGRGGQGGGQGPSSDIGGPTDPVRHWETRILVWAPVVPPSQASDTTHSASNSRIDKSRESSVDGREEEEWGLDADGREGRHSVLWMLRVGRRGREGSRAEEDEDEGSGRSEKIIEAVPCVVSVGGASADAGVEVLLHHHHLLLRLHFLDRVDWFQAGQDCRFTGGRGRVIVIRGGEGGFLAGRTLAGATMPVALGSAASSSYRDRTLELHSIAERLRKSQAFSGSATNSQSSATNGSVDGSARLQGPQSSGSVQSEFNKRASRIGLSIHQTSQKLTKLTKLAKRTSMFDDPATEIQELTAVIRTDIKALNDAIIDLQVLCNSRNDGANRSRHSSEHSTTVVDNLKSRLMNTTKEFKDVLELRTTNLKVHENRRQLFTATPTKEQSNPFSRQRPLVTVNGTSTTSNAGAGPGPGTSASASGSPAPHPWANGGASSQTPLFSSRCLGMSFVSRLGKREGICGRMPEEIEWGQDHHLMVLGVWQSFKTLLAGDLACGRDPSVGMSSRTQLRRRGNPEGTSLQGQTLPPSQQQQQLQQQIVAPAQDSYMQSREEALRNVEATIIELSTIFTHLANMVAEQGTIAVRIDSNLDEASANVEGAQGALLKYLNQISSNRWLIMKIFMVLVIFLLIFVVFVA